MITPQCDLYCHSRLMYLVVYNHSAFSQIHLYRNKVTVPTAGRRLACTSAGSR